MFQAFEEHDDIQEIKSSLTTKMFRDAYPRFTPIHVSRGTLTLATGKLAVVSAVVWCIFVNFFSTILHRNMKFIDTQKL